MQDEITTYTREMEDAVRRVTQEYERLLSAIFARYEEQLRVALAGEAPPSSLDPEIEAFASILDVEAP